MKAVQLVEVRQPLEQREVPIPTVGDRDVLVRVKAAGICHSDVHYRAGTSPAFPLPLTLGHEVAGVVEETGAHVSGVKPGDRVSIHYLATCGDCYYCSTGNEQFCAEGAMIGKHRDGGYAEFILMPARSVVPLPDEIPFEQAAVMMCSSSTSLHALRKSRLAAGETVAVFGAGGLGMSAIQLARALGALDVYVVDINPERLKQAETYGAIPVNAAETDPVEELLRLTGGKGVNVSLEVIGLAQTMEQAVQCLGVMGRAVMVGIADKPIAVDTYRGIIGKEAEIIGCSDHLLQEMPLLVEYVRRGTLDLSGVVTRTIPLDVDVINEVMDAMEEFGGEGIRTVITP